jgi:ribonuclease J
LEFAYSVHPTIPTAKTHPNLMIYYPHRLTTMMMERDKTIIYGPYSKEKKMDLADLATNPSKYVLLFRPKLLGDLKKYLADTKVCLTNSIWAQYWEQDKPEINRLKAWLAEKPELRIKLHDIHTSGHADVASLQKIVEHVQPKCIVPIHTEMPETYKTLFPSYTVLNATDETPIELINTKE